MTASLPIRREIQRKAIHLLSALIPLVYYFTGNWQIVKGILFVLAAGFLTVDVLRLKFALVRKIFLNIFKALLKEKEKSNQLTGATLLFIGMAVTGYLFGPKQAVPAMLFASLADPVAAIIGRLYGKERFWDKTLEGAAGFYFTASAIILLATNYSWWGLIVALLTAIVELLPIGIDDNLTIPVFAAYLLSLA